MQLTKTGSALMLAAAIGLCAADAAAQQRDRTMRFAGMDRNNDGVITRAEWRGNDRTFESNDWNGDGILSGDEVRPGARRSQNTRADDFAAPDQANTLNDWTEQNFRGLDHNRDNRLTRDEWHFDRESWRRADHDGDGVIVLAEFIGERTPQRSPAFQAGFDRGVLEGRTAGREDRARNQGWDLEGQRELETADSGYEPRFGPRADYQSGYRDGFRRGYREGFGK